MKSLSEEIGVLKKQLSTAPATLAELETKPFHVSQVLIISLSRFSYFLTQLVILIKNQFIKTCLSNDETVLYRLILFIYLFLWPGTLSINSYTFFMASSRPHTIVLPKGIFRIQNPLCKTVKNTLLNSFSCSMFHHDRLHFCLLFFIFET